MERETSRTKERSKRKPDIYITLFYFNFKIKNYFNNNKK